MKKTAMAFFLGLSMIACKAQVRVQAATAPQPVEEPKVEEPAPAHEEPKQGEQIALPDQIEFESNEARIKQTPSTLETLQKLADVMKENPRITKLRIEGHTDDVGRAKHNEKLSRARAEAVATWLVQHGIEEGRLLTVGFGAKRPLVPNDSEANRAQNRRTEYYVEELDGSKVAATGTAAGGKSAQ